MSKIEFNKFIGVVVFLIVLTLVKRWFSYSYALVWLGVLFGYYLPFIDHLFYAYILRPDSEVSKNIRNMISIRNLISIKKIRGLITYVNETREQREKLIIHTAYFQVVFMILTFYVLSSSGSMFGRGLVYGFSLKLLLGQVLQYLEKKEITNWFTEMPFSMDQHKTKAYLYANGLVLLIFTLML
jgi:hypothetical protein